jgi:hypothetical protein
LRRSRVLMSCRLFGVSIAVASCLSGAGSSATLAATCDRARFVADGTQSDAIAAADPEEPNRFVAALSYPKSQLLVVDALYPAPALLRQEIVDAKYRDVYLALQQSGTSGHIDISRTSSTAARSISSGV